MKAHVGDRIILAAVHINEPTRDGEITVVHGHDGEPPYTVRWSDGHEGLIYPGPGAVLRVGDPSEAAAAGRHQAVPGPDVSATPHVREWHVRVSIFERGDDTSASVVLLSEAPTHLQATGSSHRSPADPKIPEIGDEVAVARALRHLADQLAAAAEGDIEAVSGKPAHIRPD